MLNTFLVISIKVSAKHSNTAQEIRAYHFTLAVDMLNTFTPSWIIRAWLTINWILIWTLVDINEDRYG